MRDAAQKLGRFTMERLLEELGVEDTPEYRSAVINFLTELVMASSLKILRPGSYEYIRPTGSSPPRPRQPTPESAASSAVVRGGQVTQGGAPKTPHKETQQLLDAIQRQWVPKYGPIQKSGGKHFLVPHPDAPAGRVILAGTPGSANLAKTRARLRKLGLKGI